MSSVKARKSQFESGQQQKKANEAKKENKSPETSDDEEDDGGFEFADLVRALTGGADGSPGENAIDALQETFKILDSDGDGAITLPDLRVAMNGFHEVDGDDDDDENNPDDDELAEMIAAADDRGNGKISFESFVKVIDPKLAAKTFPPANKGRRLSGARSSLTVTNK